jgi:hypothetical protein
MFKLILSRRESFFKFQDEMEEETSVDADHEKQNFHRHIDKKMGSTILTNLFDKNFPLVLHGPAHEDEGIGEALERNL